MDNTAEERRNSPSPQAMAAQPSQLACHEDGNTISPRQIPTSTNALMQQRDTSPQKSVTMVQQLARSDGTGMSFLELPAEIRNMIYSYVFPEGAALLLARHSGRGYIAMWDRLELLYTCRQIFEEATSMLEAARRFTIMKPRSLQQVFDDLALKDEEGYYYPSSNPILWQIHPDDMLFFDYDLNRGVVKKNAPALLYVSTSWTRLILQSMSVMRLTARASITTSRFALNGFSALQNWLTRVPTFLRSSRNCFTVIDVAFTFKMNRPTSLAEIRIEMSSLSDAMIKDTPGGHLGTADLEVRIEHLGVETSNTRLFVDTLAEAVLFLQNTVRIHPELRDEPCPQIWMDGHFRVREALFPSKNGKTLELINKKEFWWPWTSAENYSWDELHEMDQQGKWEDMVSQGLVSGLDVSQSHRLDPKHQVAGETTLEEASKVLAKRVAYVWCGP